MPVRIFLAAAVAAFFVLVTQVTPSQAAQCDKLPPVEWWTKSHAKVIDTVNKKYKGNWKKYIDRWISYRDRMQKLYLNKSTAIVKSRRIKLRGKHLARHVKHVEARIKVLQCLSRNNSGEKGNDQKDANSSVQVTEVSSDRLEVEISARCEKTTPVFLITNLGDRWPRLGEIKIYDIEKQSMLSTRRVRMRNSQQATFRVKKRGGGSYDTVGL